MIWVEMFSDCSSGMILNLKVLSTTAADDFLIFFYFYFSKKIRLGISCESSARQMIHMKFQVMCSLKNNENM